MPYIHVVLKNGTRIPVPDAETAGWENKFPFPGASTRQVILVCKNEQGREVGEFLQGDVIGWVWHDGRLA